MTLKEEILESIQNGKKAIDLYLDLSDLNIDKDIIDATIEDMIHSGDVIELEYTTPNMDYRIKSIYFPKGSNLKIRQL